MYKNEERSKVSKENGKAVYAVWNWDAIMISFLIEN